MGHWSTYSRRGGGQGAATALLHITLCVVEDSTTLQVFWDGDVSAGAFELTDFNSQPSDQSPDVIIQVDTNSIFLQFTSNIDSDQDINYTGDVAGLLTPDTRPIQ